MNTPEGLYLGEAVVSDNGGTYCLLAIKTTGENIDFEITRQKIFTFDLCEFPSEPTSDSGLDGPTDNLQIRYLRRKKVACRDRFKGT